MFWECVQVLLALRVLALYVPQDRMQFLTENLTSRLNLANTNHGLKSRSRLPTRRALFNIGLGVAEWTRAIRTIHVIKSSIFLKKSRQILKMVDIKIDV